MEDSDGSYAYESESEEDSEDEKEYLTGSPSGNQSKQLNYTVISPVRLHEIQVQCLLGSSAKSSAHA